MSIQTVQEQRNQNKESRSKLDELAELNQRSVGSWVECYCTKVDTDELEFTFETLHDYKSIKEFDIPDTFEGSDVDVFLNRVGYSPENAKLMEGERFWMHMDKEIIQNKLPTSHRFGLYNIKIPKISNIILSKKLGYLLTIPIFPVWGVAWMIWEYSEEGTGRIYLSTFVTILMTVLCCYAWIYLPAIVLNLSLLITFIILPIL